MQAGHLPKGEVARKRLSTVNAFSRRSGTTQGSVVGIAAVFH
jgi:hypothetical protein